VWNFSIFHSQLTQHQWIKGKNIKYNSMLTSYIEPLTRLQLQDASISRLNLN